MTARHPWAFAVAYYTVAALCVVAGLTEAPNAAVRLACAVAACVYLYAGYRSVLDGLYRRDRRHAEQAVIEAAERAAHLPRARERHPAGRDGRQP